jgi:hypothetical protein
MKIRDFDSRSVILSSRASARKCCI